MMLNVNDVSYRIGDKPILRGCSLDVQDGETLGLVGPNGAGKSTLLRTLYGALTPDSGTVTVAGRDLAQLSAREIAKVMAVVVQEPAGDISLSVADTVLMGRTPHRGIFGTLDTRDEEIAEAALSRVRAADLASRGMDELSGGEKQRVFIARALCQEPSLLLLDEPTNHLDISAQHQILSLISDLPTTCVVVLHDLNLAARYCDRIALIADGDVIHIGSPEDVLNEKTVAETFAVQADRVYSPDAIAQLLFRREVRTEVGP